MRSKNVSETDYLKTAEVKPEIPFTVSFHFLRWNTSYAGGGSETSYPIAEHRELRTNEYQIHEQLGS
jgi:hypothetical protein